MPCLMHRRRVAAATFFTSIVFATLLASGTTAAAGSLFDNPTAAEMRAAPQLDVGAASTMRGGLRGPERILRQRLVRLNAAELSRVVPVGADRDGNRIARARALNAPVTLDLFPGVSVTAQRTDVETPEAGGYVWTGRGNGGRPSDVTLVINNNEILGHIQSGGKLYSVEHVSGNLHRVIEIDQDKIRDDMHIPLLPELQNQMLQRDGLSLQTVTPRASSTLSTINVMVAHTATARAEVGTATQMQARIDMAISLANQAFANSGVYIRFTRVGGANEINYNEASYYGGIGTNKNYVGSLCDLSGIGCSSLGVANSRSSVFAALRSKRTSVGADLVVLMRKQGAYCGVAWVLDPPTSSTSGQGYSVATASPSYSCLEGNTLAHETGHNLGLHHDRATHKAEGGGSPSANKFNFGYVDKTGKFFDIMAYRSACGTGCTRAPYFSTPLRKYPDPTTGRALGIPQGTPGAADAARALNASRITVSAYR